MKKLMPLVLAVATGCVGTEEGLDAKEFKELGDHYYSEGQWDRAAHEYMLAIKEDDEMYEAYVALAYTFRSKGMYELIANPNVYGRRKADEWFRESERWALKCLEEDDGNAEAMHVIGLLYYDASKLEKAIEWFDKTLDHDPRHIHANLYRSWCFFFTASRLRVDAQELAEKKDVEGEQKLLREARGNYASAAKAMEDYIANYEKMRNIEAPNEPELRHWIKILADLQKNDGVLSEEGRRLSAKISTGEPQPEVIEGKDGELPETHE